MEYILQFTIQLIIYTAYVLQFTYIWRISFSSLYSWSFIRNISVSLHTYGVYPSVYIHMEYILQFTMQLIIHILYSISLRYVYDVCLYYLCKWYIFTSNNIVLYIITQTLFLKHASMKTNSKNVNFSKRINFKKEGEHRNISF